MRSLCFIRHVPRHDSPAVCDHSGGHRVAQYTKIRIDELYRLTCNKRSLTFHVRSTTTSLDLRCPREKWCRILSYPVTLALSEIGNAYVWCSCRNTAPVPVNRDAIWCKWCQRRFASRLCDVITWGRFSSLGCLLVVHPSHD